MSEDTPTFDQGDFSANEAEDSNVPENETGPTGDDLSPEDRMHTNPTNIPSVANNPDKIVVSDIANKGYLETVNKNVAALDYHGEPELREIDFVYTSHMDPARRADKNGVYLDDVNRAKAEIQRARVEGREADLKNPPATAATQVMPTHVANSLFPGDYEVTPDFSQEVMVGVNEENQKFDIEAMRARAAAKSGKKN